MGTLACGSKPPEPTFIPPTPTKIPTPVAAMPSTPTWKTVEYSDAPPAIELKSLEPDRATLTLTCVDFQGKMHGFVAIGWNEPVSIKPNHDIAVRVSWDGSQGMVEQWIVLASTRHVAPSGIYNLGFRINAAKSDLLTVQPLQSHSTKPARFAVSGYEEAIEPLKAICP